MFVSLPIHAGNALLTVQFPSELQVADSDPIRILPESHENLATVPLLSTVPPSKLSAGHISAQ